MSRVVLHEALVEAIIAVPKGVMEGRSYTGDVAWACEEVLIRWMATRGKDEEAELDKDALTVAHVAVEDELVDMRDRCMSVIGPANGFVIRSKDGQDNGILRLGTRDGIAIAIRAYLTAVGTCSCYPDPRDHEEGCVRHG